MALPALKRSSRQSDQGRLLEDEKLELDVVGEGLLELDWELELDEAAGDGLLELDLGLELDIGAGDGLLELDDARLDDELLEELLDE